MQFRARGLALVASVGLVVAACGGGGDDTSAEATPETTGDSAAAEGALVVWADETRAPVIEDIGADFEADTGVAVEVVQKDFGTIRDDLVSQGPSGQGPDVIIGAHDWIGKLVQNGAITPVELGDKTSEFEQVSIDAVSYDGQVYGMPYSIENIALFRNADLAPDKPGSWDEMIATGQQLVADGTADLPFAVQMDGEKGDPYHFYPLQTSYGAFVFGQTEDGSWNPDDLQLDNEGGQQFAQDLSQWGADGIVSTSVTADIAKETFNTGKVAYWITGPWNVADAQDAGINLVVEDIPGPGGQTAAPFVGVQAFMISNYSENKLIANEFVVNYASTEEVADALFETGGRPPALIASAEKVADDPILAGFAAVGAEGSPLPNIPAMDAVWEEWGLAEGAIVNGAADPVGVWNQMAEKVRENIAGA